MILFKNLFYKFVCWFFFSNTELVYPENLVKKTPVLYIGVSDGNILDSFIYTGKLPNIKKVFSTNQNTKYELKQGNNVLISQISPNTAKMINSYVTEENQLTVQLINIQYDNYNNLMPKAELILSKPIYFTKNLKLTESEAIKSIGMKMSAALDDITLNFPDKSYASHIKQLATIATFDNNSSFFNTLKSFEKNIATDISVQFITYKNTCKDLCLNIFNDAIIFPTKKIPYLISQSIFLAFFVTISAIINFIPTIATLLLLWKHKKTPSININNYLIKYLPLVLLVWQAIIISIFSYKINYLFIFLYLGLTVVTPKILHKLYLNILTLKNYLHSKTQISEFNKLRRYIIKYIGRKNSDNNLKTYQYFSY